MGHKGDPISAKIAELARLQWGHVTRVQLLALGLGAGAIRYRIRTGELIPVHSGVYAVGYRREEPVARAAAAVLAAGEGAVLSHDSAAALWALGRRWPAAAEISTDRWVRRAGIKAHQCVTLAARDCTTQLGIRVTRPARTISDIRPRLTDKQFTRMVNSARLEKLISEEEQEAFLGHRGNPTRSGHEDAFGRLARARRLPPHLTTAKVDGSEVDVLFPEQKVIVELDDYATHGDRATFVSDRRRIALHAASGHLTVRLAPEMITGEDIENVVRALQQRGWSESSAEGT